MSLNEEARGLDHHRQTHQTLSRASRPSPPLSKIWGVSPFRHTGTAVTALTGADAVWVLRAARRVDPGRDLIEMTGTRRILIS